MAKQKKVKSESFKAATLKRFKDLDIFEVFTYKGDECLCERQENGSTIFDNRTQNKRYVIDAENILS